MGWGDHPPILWVGLLVMLRTVVIHGTVAPCTFNMMCTCRYGAPGTNFRLGFMNNMTHVSELHCSKVPFAKLPGMLFIIY